MNARARFLAALRIEIASRHEWAETNPEKLESFLQKTRETMDTDRNLVIIDSPAFVAAWREIGNKGKPTFKALRALAA